jgi:hypothetical protein
VANTYVGHWEQYYSTSISSAVISVTPVAAGDLLVVSAVAGNGAVISSVVGGGVSTWISGPQGGAGEYQWYGTVTTAGVVNLTVTWATANTVHSISVDEYSSGLGSTTLWTVQAPAAVNGSASTTILFPGVTLPAVGNPIYIGYAVGTSVIGVSGLQGISTVNLTTDSSVAVIYDLSTGNGTVGFGPTVPQASSGLYYTVALVATPSLPVISVVQQAVCGAGSTPQVATFGVSPTVGNCLIAAVTVTTSGGGATVTGGGVTTWNKIAGATSDGVSPATISSSEIWYGFVTSSGTPAVSIACAAGTNYPSAVVYECSGVYHSSPVATSSKATGTGTSMAITAASAPVVGQFVVAVATSNGSSEPTVSATGSPGWANTTGNGLAFVVSQVAPTTAALTAAWAVPSIAWTASAAVFNPNPPGLTLVQQGKYTGVTSGQATVTLAANTTVGNCLIVEIGAYDQTSTTAPTGGGVTTWTKIPGASNAAVNFITDIWYGFVTTSSATAIVTQSFGASSYPQLAVQEWYGVSTSTPVSAGGIAPQVTTPITTPALAVSAGQLTVSTVMCIESSWTTVPSGLWTVVQNTGGSLCSGENWQVATSSGTPTATWASSASVVSGSAAVFNPVGAITVFPVAVVATSTIPVVHPLDGKPHLVQQTPVVAVAQATPESFTLPAPATVGNCLIVEAVSLNGTGLGITGGGVGVWNRAVANDNATNAVSAEIWYGFVTTAGQSTVTLNTAASGYPTGSVQEWYGISAAAPVASTAIASHASSVTITAPGLTVALGQLTVIAGATAAGAVTSLANTVPSPAGWTATPNGTGASLYFLDAAYQIATPASLTAPSWTSSPSGQSCSAGAVFNPSASVPSLVQSSAPAVYATGASSTAVLSSAATIGNCLIAGVEAGGGGVNTTTLSGGGVATWIKVPGATVENSGTYELTSEVWYGFVTTSGQTVVTVTDSVSGSDPLVFVQEWSGISASNPVASAATHANTTNASTLSGPTLTAGPGQLAWVIANGTGSGVSLANTSSAGAGWTALNGGGTTGGSTSYNLAAYQVVSTTLTAAWTANTAGANVAAGAVFAPAIVGPGINLVQATPATAINAASPTTINLVLGTTIGNCLTVEAVCLDGSGLVISGGGVTTWNKIAGSADDNTTNGESSEIWYGFITSVATTVTATSVAGGSDYPTLSAQEWSDVAVAGTVAQAAVATSTSSVATIVAPNLSVAPGQLAIVAGAVKSGGGGALVAPANVTPSGGGWIAAPNGLSAGDYFLNAAYQVASTTATLTAVWTPTVSGTTVASGVVLQPVGAVAAGVLAGTSTTPSPAVGIVYPVGVLAATSTFPAPVVSSGITPLPLVATSSFPAPVVVATQSAVTAAVVATSTTPALSVSAGASVAVAALTETSTFPAPTILVAANVLAATLVCTVSFPTETVSGGESIHSVAVVGTSAFPAPTVASVVSVTAAPVVVVATSVFPAPTVSDGSSVFVVALLATSVFPAPTLFAGASISAQPLSVVGASTFFPSALSAESFVVPADFIGTSAFPTQRIEGDNSITPTSLVGIVAFPAPSLANDTAVPVSTIVGTAELFALAVSVGDSAFPADLSGSSAQPVPTLTADANVIAPVLLATSTMPLPYVAAALFVLVAPGVFTASSIDPSVVASASSSSSPGALAATSQFPAVTLFAGQAVTAAPTVVAGSDLFPAPSVAVSESVVPASVSATSTVAPVMVLVDSNVDPACLAAQGHFPAQSAQIAEGGSVVLQPQPMDAVFFAPVVTAGVTAKPVTRLTTAAFPIAGYSAGQQALVDVTTVTATPVFPHPVVVGQSPAGTSPDSAVFASEQIPPTVAVSVNVTPVPVVCVSTIYVASGAIVVNAYIDVDVLTAVGTLLAPILLGGEDQTVITSLNLAGAIAQYLTLFPDIVSLVGQDATGIWIYQQHLFKIVKGTSQSAIVVTTGPAWAPPNTHNTAKFPRVSIEVYSDVQRDSSGQLLVPDAEITCERILWAIDRHMHRPQGGILPVSVGDQHLRVLTSTRMTEPVYAPLSDGEGVVGGLVEYATTVG